MGGTYAALIVLAVIVVFILITLAKTIRVIPQARAGVVERLGRYSRTLTPGLAIVIPFVDRVRQLVDLREQVMSFDPQPVITQASHSGIWLQRRARYRPNAAASSVSPPSRSGRSG